MHPGQPKAALALGAPAAAAALVAAAHVVPAGTWLPGLRRACLPALAGLGHPDRVALTFDDGPDPGSTPYFLELLDELSVHATFFVLGESLLRHPGLGRDIVRRGHELAVHGWTHSRPWAPTPGRDLREVSAAAEAVRRTAGTRPLWYRPPYGILTGGRWAAARRCGLRPVLWSAWGRDWEPDATPGEVLATVRGQLRGGGGTVLLHDADLSGRRSWRAALAMLPELVGGLRAEGMAVGPLAGHGLPPDGRGRFRR
ncbi:polysaccharide deacetylase family protein [Streptomyces nitrosporeus]|uniref:polysaccharide deacetylase family protein n=1 Tax=Streptomyces nitrosporeus TaxID=28894 RepID=UPI0039A39D5F